ncbi:TraK family protein [Desulfovibrio sp. JC010]|uniref:TraK family protein n=1 Tax=Desulfovibrio sp. JC010 TaxID=2593641 RepID=UPI0013D6A9AC
MNKNKGFAKIEFIANLGVINRLHEKGFNKKMIYKTLIKEEKITMSYPTYCRYHRTKTNETNS